MDAIRPTPAELSDPTRYVLLEEVPHENLVPKIGSYLKRSSPIKTSYIVANLVTLAVISVLWVRTGTSLRSLPTLCVGMFLGALVLPPIHEWIHALT